MQYLTSIPLILAFSRGEKENFGARSRQSPKGELNQTLDERSLSPRERDRVRVKVAPN